MPPFGEIKPGLIIEIEGLGKKTVEILGMPYNESGSDDWWVNISDQDGHRRSITLADQGIVPYSGGTWNTDNRPVKWYKKEDMKQ